MKRWKPDGLAQLGALIVLAVLALIGAAPAWAQTVGPDAGALMRQTERDRQDLLTAPPPSAFPLATTPAPAPATSSADDGTRITVQRFELHGNRLISSTSLQATLERWSGHPASLADLRQAAAAVEQLYRERGWLAQASLPAQDVSAGTVKIEIVEAQLGRIRFTPDSSAVAPRLLDRVKLILQSDLPAGEPLNLRRLERSLLVAAELPGVAVSGSLQAGSQAASTDLLVNVSATPRTRTEVAADNGANRATGATRVNAQFTGYSLLNGGDRLNLGLALTEASQYLGAEASAPLPLAALADWRAGVHASALAYHVLPAMNTSAGLPPRGHTEVLGAGLEYPWLRTPMAALNLKLGVDRRAVTAEDSSANPATLALASVSHADLLTLGLSGSLLDHLGGGGSTQAGLSLTEGHLSLAGSPAAHVANDSATAATQGLYTVTRWSLSRLQTLRPEWSMLVAAQGQLASKNLDPAEKFYLGGMNGVRAYPSGEGGGSNGWLLNLELRKQFGAKWLASAFVDRGQVGQYARDLRADGAGVLVAGNRVTLSGRGVALEFHGDRGQVVKAGLARRNGSNPLATPTGNDTDGSLVKNRIWISASFAF